MVRYKTIISVVDDYVLKCSPKYNALQYFKKHKDEFQEESWRDGVNPSDNMTSPTGHLFNEQEHLQHNTDYTSSEKEYLKRYSEDIFSQISYYNNGVLDEMDEQGIYDEDYHWVIPFGSEEKVWQLLISTYDDGKFLDANYVDFEEICSHIDSSIDKSPSLQEDSVIYRYGRLPVDKDGIPVGVDGHGTFRSYTSTTYNSNLVFNDEAFLRNNNWIEKKDLRYNLTIYAPKGTKGVVLGDSVDCNDWQNELLLGRGQRCIVLSRDDENRTAEILLY